MTVMGINIFQALLAQKGQESSTHTGETEFLSVEKQQKNMVPLKGQVKGSIMYFEVFLNVACAKCEEFSHKTEIFVGGTWSSPGSLLACGAVKIWHRTSR